MIDRNAWEIDWMKAMHHRLIGTRTTAKGKELADRLQRCLEDLRTPILNMMDI